MDIKFISYTGEYPNLCTGVLTLEINGEQIEFKGSDPKSKYPSFWFTGGRCYFTNNYAEEHVEEGEWEINDEWLTDELKPYAADIIRIFNENVPHGCCGGCL